MIISKDTEIKINRDDWIGRFFGYLGSRKYLYERTRGEDAISIGYIPHEEAENIIYIYGAPKNGKSAYLQMLGAELKKKEEYTYSYFNMRDIDEGTTVTHFQETLRRNFEEKLGFAFPCMDILEKEEFNYGEATFKLLKYAGIMWKGVNTILAGSLSDRVELVKQAYDKGKELLVNNVYKEEDKKVFQEIKTEMERFLESKNEGFTVFSENDLFDFLRLDLCANAKRNWKKKRFICIIDSFECRHRLCSSEPFEEELLKMMSSVHDIIWVLLSTENPDGMIQKFVARDNQWRMAGASKRRVLEYLKLRVPEQDDKWYDGVYENTGGYISLLSACVDAQLDEKTRFCSEEALAKGREEERKKALDREREFLTQEKDKAAKEGNLSKVLELFDRLYNLQTAKVETDDVKLYEEQLSDWFTMVWNSRNDLWNNVFAIEGVNKQGISAKEYIWACLFYLAECSGKNVGTIWQYSWKRGDNIRELNKDGNKCIRVIEQSTPFCLGYKEYPEMLYLDPVIVKFLLKLKQKEKCLETFRLYCKGEQEEKPAEEKRQFKYPVSVYEENAVGQKDTAEANKDEKELIPEQVSLESSMTEQLVEKQEALPIPVAAGITDSDEESASSEMTNRVEYSPAKMVDSETHKVTKNQLLNEKGEVAIEKEENGEKE